MEFEEPIEGGRWEWTAAATPRSEPTELDETMLRILREHSISVDTEVESFAVPDGDEGRVAFTITTDTRIVGLEDLMRLATTMWEERELPDRRPDLPERLRDADAWLVDVEWPQDERRAER